MENVKTYYLYNGNLEDATAIESRVIAKNAIYEVIKVVEAKPLFLEDHMERFSNSMKKMGYTLELTNEEVLKDMILLTRANLNKNTNIQIICIPVEEGYDFMMSLTDGLSATDEQKKNGVAVETVPIERENPAIKTVGASYKGQIRSQSKNEDTFEILLVNSEGVITEGSRTNVFFIKDGKVVTTPSQNVLLGVTRKYILALCEKNGIQIEYRNVREEEVAGMDGAFLTGTTVDVTPIVKVNDLAFSGIDPVISTLRDQYEALMHTYLDQFEV